MPLFPPTLKFDIAMDRPSILLAHGGWYRTHLYGPLTEALASRSYTLTEPAVPAMGAKLIGTVWEVDTKTLLYYAEPLVTQGKEVQFIAHSYGGIPASVDTRENSVAGRARRGISSGFCHIVFARLLSLLELLVTWLPFQ